MSLFHVFCFFKQKTAYEVSSCLVGSDMCIRDSCYSPSLGPFAATVGVHGDILVPEDRIRHALNTASAKGMSVHQAMERLLGTEWDEELEQFRYGSEDAPIRWLHQVV